LNFFCLKKSKFQSGFRYIKAISNSLPVFASKVQGNIQVSKYIGKKYIKLIKNDEKSVKSAILSIINN